MNIMDQALDRDLSFAELTYIKGMDKQLSTEAQDIVKKSFICEASWARRVLKSAPCSTERSELMKMMYDDIHNRSQEIDRVLGRELYFSAEKPNEKAVASINCFRPKGRCLEIGCGGGSLTWGLALHGWEVLGIDLVEESSWSKIEKQTMGRAKFQVADIAMDDVNTLGSDYDLIVMEQCLEHIPPGDYEIVLAKACTLLRAGGAICLVFPNALCGPFDISQYFVERGKKALGGHFNERSMKDQARDLAMAGFIKNVSVAYGGLPAGRRFGWTRFWYFKARVCETLFRLLPPQWRSRRIFPYLVPPVIAAFKP